MLTKMNQNQLKSHKDGLKFSRQIEQNISQIYQSWFQTDQQKVENAPKNNLVQSLQNWNVNNQKNQVIQSQDKLKLQRIKKFSYQINNDKNIIQNERTINRKIQLQQKQKKNQRTEFSLNKIIKNDQQEGIGSQSIQHLNNESINLQQLERPQSSVGGLRPTSQARNIQLPNLNDESKKIINQKKIKNTNYFQYLKKNKKNSEINPLELDSDKSSLYKVVMNKTNNLQSDSSKSILGFKTNLDPNFIQLFASLN